MIEFETKRLQHSQDFIFNHISIALLLFANLRCNVTRIIQQWKKTTYITNASLRHIYASSVRLPQLCRFNSWENQRGGLGQSAQYLGLIRLLPVAIGDGESVVLCLARTRSHGCCCNNSVLLSANKAIHGRRNRSLNEIPSDKPASQAAKAISQENPSVGACV